jgi:hypothetical protein
MTFSSRPRPNAPALLAVAVLHAALAGLLLAQRYRVTHQHQHQGPTQEPIQWLLPLAAPPAAKTPAPDRAPAVAPAAPPQRVPAPRAGTAARAATIIAPPAAPATAPASPAPSLPAPASAPDPFDLASTPPAPATEAQLRRHDWGAGKADHALRGGKLSTLVRPTDTLQAGLERAFRDAGEAAPLKWFSAPEIREISVPESRMRMYKIRTAAGTYCFYKPDPSLQAGYDYKLMTCPREK